MSALPTTQADAAQAALPSISVITVAYNDLKNLKKTLSNLLSLPHAANFEYIVVDGGSSDGTKEYLSSIIDARLKWTSEPDNGLYDAMNKGIERASKDWLWFINAGDFIEPALITPDLTQSKQPLIFVPLRDNDRLVTKRKPEWQIPYCHQGVLFKNDPAIRYDIRYKIAADYKYILHYLKKYQLSLRDISVINSKSVVIGELNGISRQNRVARDLEAARISWEHYGLCSNILFFAALLTYQYLRRMMNRS